MIPRVSSVLHLTSEALEAGLDEVRQSPRDEGRVELIVCRPAENERDILDEALLDGEQGLHGDTWRARTHSPADAAERVDRQLTLMNARAAALVAGDPDRRPLAGDQLYVDLDISIDNLPAGTRLQVGSAVVEVSEKPHTGCKKFAARFGEDALRFVNSPVGKAMRLRGLNARVLTAGTVRAGDVIRKLPAR
jgi:MOSC domain-containing protein YiiM